jgi:glycosidase
MNGSTRRGPQRDSGPLEFHVARQARRKYEFDETLFSVRGNVIFANFHAARLFAQKMNDKRDLAHRPEQAVSAGQINAMGLIDEVLHLVIQRYREQRNPQVIQQALTRLDQQLGQAAVDRTLTTFADEFPPMAVYRGEIALDDYLQGSTERIPNREILLEELLMLWLANMNPAFEAYRELFDDQRLTHETAYPQIIAGLQEFFKGQPGFGGAPGSSQEEDLITVLRSPALKMPHSLAAQLEFLLGRVSSVLGGFLYRLLTSLDLIKEEEKISFIGTGGPGGPGPVEIYNFAGQELEHENFTADREWMPQLVLIAKNAFVWLDQLAKKYRQPINTLDQIPDQELDALARAGITGLWLIGLWERSVASRTIKQMMGNPDAVASAYSLFDYQIAADLGGEAAVQNLRERAWRRGIRLASDMVPNHVGIDGRWVVEHPDWFLSLDYSPYPSYSFNGPDLSWDERVGVFLEDHYFDRTDAAVVFKRLDKQTGSVRYIYHGNDGTSMPWNDTAQIDYLNADAREAVIQTILHVARQFPIIRFDAAMTLAKRHVQRLWFPEPGSGGAIASRSEHALTKAQFDALMPHEFWREVVDRAATEAPDTLLLAEAFWMMEGYFVRTLGMHRVYNSAFMHLLRDEDNVKYRAVMKNTLEFDTEIMRRFVNFMNNPDERTAIDQFGKDDKYFGVCVLMSTMPGLPMFGHGQIEGFTEKYGMEYRRAYFDEQPDQYLIQRHEREIFPLLHRRYLFAGTEQFLLYDCFSADGGVNEDVFAYSNRAGDERSLVLYHNKYATARGWIKTSVAYSARHDNGERSLTHRSLAEGLGLHNEDGYFCLFRDQITGLEYIRSSKTIAEQGLYVELGAYQYHVFLDLREVRDNEWRQYSRLNSHLNGRGAPSLDEASREIFLEPIHTPFRALVNAELFQRLIDARAGASSALIEDERAEIETHAVAEIVEEARELGESEIVAAAPVAEPHEPLLAEVERKLRDLLRGIHELTGSGDADDAVVDEVRAELRALLQLGQPQAIAANDAAPTAALPQRDRARASDQALAADAAAPPAADALAELHAQLGDDPIMWGALLSWLFTHPLGRLINAAGADGATTADTGQQSASLIDEWLLGKVISGAMRELGQDDADAWRTVALVKLLCSTSTPIAAPDDAQTAAQVLASWLADRDMQWYVQVNRHRDMLWFNKEALDRLLWLLLAATAITTGAQSQQPPAPITTGAQSQQPPAPITTGAQSQQPPAATMLTKSLALIRAIQQVAESAGYQIDAVINEAKPAPQTAR